MPPRARVMHSEYMHWAKTRIHAAFNIGASGVANYPLASLPVTLADLEITGDSFYGYAPLQEAIARYAGVPAGRVCAALGTSQANHLAMAALLSPGDEVLIEDPSYELIVSTALYLGAEVRRFPRERSGGFAADPAEVARRMTSSTRLVVLTNLHNPTSAPVDEASLAAIGRLCAERGARVLVDEVYLDSAFDRPPRSAALMGDEFIVTSSLTKVYGLSGLRCGWVLAEPSLVESMWRLKDLFENIPPHVSELLSVVAFEHLDPIRDRARSMIVANRKTFREMLLQRHDIDCYDPGFGTVVFPELRRGDVDRLAETLLREHGTLITPGRFFGMPRNFRIGLGGEPGMFRVGMTRLCRALDAAAR